MREEETAKPTANASTFPSPTSYSTAPSVAGGEPDSRTFLGGFSLVYSQSLALGCSSARDNGTALPSWSDRDVAVRQPPTWARGDRDAKQSAQPGAGAEGGIAASYLFA